MTEKHQSHFNPHKPGVYEIRVDGVIPVSRESWFDDMTISYQDDGQTILRGEVVDQSALHGLLNKIRDLNLPLLSVKYLSDSEETDM